MQQEKEEKAFELLRCLYRISPESFALTSIDCLKQLNSQSIERFEPFDPSTLPMDGDSIFLKKAVLRIWRTSSAFGFVGVNGSRYEYLPGEFEKDLETHKSILEEIRNILEPLDVSASSSELADSLISELQQAKSAKLRDNFLRTRRELGLLGAELALSNTHEHRVTHCYSCKMHLESDLFMECSACRWIVCICGACGCGYNSASTG
jgi:hypothetical protein